MKNNILTNFVIGKPDEKVSKRVEQTFEKGIDVKQELKAEAFHILDSNGLDIEKAHVKAHQRKSKSSKSSQVKEYDDSRHKAALQHAKEMMNYHGLLAVHHFNKMNYHSN